jgi:hypothetical protein
MGKCPGLKPAFMARVFRGMNAPAPSGFARRANGFAIGRKADSLTGMTDRKAKAKAGLAFVVSHPCRKGGGKDGAPSFAEDMKGNARVGPLASSHFSYKRPIGKDEPKAPPGLTLSQWLVSLLS